jgi:hypothetical protein
VRIIRLKAVRYYKADKNQPIFLTLEVALNQIKAEPEKYVNNKTRMLEGAYSLLKFMH